MRKILVHTCCAPCFTCPCEWLAKEGFQPTSYFYNPNIYPESEYVKRYFTLKEYLNSLDIPLIFEFDNSKIEPKNCAQCYLARLRKTAEYAKSNGFKIFTTTLLISPYQDHGLLKECGEKTGRDMGIDFFYQDFRVGYKESRNISKINGLYMQKYCGCSASLIERGKIYEQIA